MILKRTIGLLSVIILLFNLISCKEKQVLGSYNMSLRGFVEEKVNINNIRGIEDIKMIDDDTIKLIGMDNNLKEVVLMSEDKGKTWVEKEIELTDLKKDRIFF